MNKTDLCKLSDARRQLFSLSVPSVRSKLAFLRNELNMDDADIRKVLLKFPRFIEYKTERTVRPRLDFLLKHGVVQGDLSKVRYTWCRDKVSKHPAVHIVPLCIGMAAIACFPCNNFRMIFKWNALQGSAVR